jgi:hypothetical protein
LVILPYLILVINFKVDMVLLKPTYPQSEILNHSLFHCFNIDRNGTPAKHFGMTLALITVLLQEVSKVCATG